ncbi:hypothetical protein AAHD56_17460, partial [Enterobacter kobei]
NGGKNSLNRLIRCVCGKKIGPDPRNFNQRVSLGRNDLLIRTFLKETPETAALKVKWQRQGSMLVVTNPTAIHVNVIDVAIDGKPLDLAMIMPFETRRLALPAGVSKMLT